MLISLHMPKTAGLSFRSTLEGHFGKGFRPDYQDYPLAAAPVARHEQARRFGLEARAEEYSGVDCIHGHFLPVKYLPLASSMTLQFVTWLREPVARLVSHYYYWQRAYDPASAETSSLHRRVVEEKWTLEQFCLSAELQDVYCQFLWNFPPERVDFIGITEFFQEDLRYFSARFLGSEALPEHLNRREVGSETDGEPEITRGLLAQIRDFHAGDIALYEDALALRSRHRA